MDKYLPGFRSGKKYKKCIAISYYLFTSIAAISAKDIGLFIGYIGLPVAILNFSEYRINKEKGFKMAGVFGTVTFLIGMWLSGSFASYDTVSPTSANIASNIEVSKIKKEEKQEEIKNVDLTFEFLSEDQDTAATEILYKCGVNNIKSTTYDGNLDWDNLKGYRLSTEYDKVGDVIAYFDGAKLSEVRFVGEYLYNGGEVVGVATDMFLTTSQQSDYQIKCKKVVESILKSPATAKFPNITKWNIGKVDGKVIVQSYVDSQNSFGAMLRAEFQFIIEDDNITSFIFDGQEMMN